MHWGESDVVAPDPASDSFINGEPVRTICRGAYSYADARLIAAAPDLFEALSEMLTLGEMFIPVSRDAPGFKRARAALARARGETE